MNPTASPGIEDYPPSQTSPQNAASSKQPPVSSPQAPPQKSFSFFFSFLCFARSDLQGWQLGSDSDVQVATLSSNHLSSALMKYFKTMGRWQQGLDFFHHLRNTIDDVDLLLAQLYLEMDEEVKAVDLMCTALVANPLQYGFIVEQARFLLRKKRPDLAVELAKAAVNANPSEYATWAILTESYIAVDDYEHVPPQTPAFPPIFLRVLGC
jgi:ChAPs (Chs5p-Arf1p-binding proteins)